MLVKFALKVILNGFILSLLIFWYTKTSFTESVMAAVIFTVAAWIVGDLFILRSTNNTVATIADFGLAYIYLWIVADAWNWNLTFGEIFIISLIVGFAEWFFHRYIMSVDRVTL